MSEKLDRVELPDEEGGLDNNRLPVPFFDNREGDTGEETIFEEIATSLNGGKSTTSNRRKWIKRTGLLAGGLFLTSLGLTKLPDVLGGKPEIDAPRQDTLSPQQIETVWKTPGAVADVMRSQQLNIYDQSDDEGYDRERLKQLERSLEDVRCFMLHALGESDLDIDQINFATLAHRFHREGGILGDGKKQKSWHYTVMGGSHNVSRNPGRLNKLNDTQSTTDQAEVVQHHKPTTIGYHAGLSGVNARSIGIETADQIGVDMEGLINNTVALIVREINETFPDRRFVLLGSQESIDNDPSCIYITTHRHENPSKGRCPHHIDDEQFRVIERRVANALQLLRALKEQKYRYLPGVQGFVRQRAPR